jgi:type I restriction enzyme S subunit
MSGEWKTVHVQDIAKRTATGPFGSAISSKHFLDSGVPVIRGSNLSQMISTRFDDSGLVFISEEKAQEFKRSEVRRGELVFTCWGTIDQVGLIDSRAKYDRYIVSNKQMLLTPDESRADSLFIYYYFASPETRAKILNEGIGSSVPGFNLGQLRSFEILLPPLAEQKAIAAVLGALDDKIELNRRMNATLDAMARALFQSWFVDFDPVRAKLDGRQPVGMDEATAALFPSHFDHKAEGVIPTGWRATTLGEVIELFDSKRIPLSGRERDARQGKFPYHGAASVMDYVDDFLFDGIYALMGEDGSVINEDGTPVLQYVWGQFWVNNHAHVLRGKNGISTEHLLLHLKGCNIAPFVTGAVQPKLNQGNMNRIPFMLAPPEIGQAFAKAIEPLFAQIRANTEQSRTLATLRDTLLPKLLSGELSVAGLESKLAATQ